MGVLWGSMGVFMGEGLKLQRSNKWFIQFSLVLFVFELIIMIMEICIAR